MQKLIVVHRLETFSNKPIHVWGVWSQLCKWKRRFSSQTYVHLWWKGLPTGSSWTGKRSAYGGINLWWHRWDVSCCGGCCILWRHHSFHSSILHREFYSRVSFASLQSSTPPVRKTLGYLLTLRFKVSLLPSLSLKPLLVIIWFVFRMGGQFLQLLTQRINQVKAFLTQVIVY